MSSILKVDTIQDQDGNNIINESANTITIGASGDTITIPSGATLANSGIITGFQSTGIDDNATSTAITINSSENVGIGTNSPSAKLEVQTSEATAGDNYSTAIRITNSLNYGYGVGIDFAQPPTSGAPVAVTGAITNDYNSDNNYSTRFYTFNSGSLSEKMRIDANGNVGIGVSSPERALSIFRTSTPMVALYNSTTGSDGGDGFQLQLVNDDGYLWNYESGGFTSFGTANTERMRITSAGNVGIGTSSPTVPLEVSGSAIIGGQMIATGSTTTTASRRAIMTHDGTSMKLIASGDSTNRNIIFERSGDGSADETMRINSSGQTLIGTTVAPDNANTKLMVHTPISSSSLNVIEMSHNTNGANKAGAALGLSIGNGGEATNAASLLFKTASNGSLGERMRISPTGEVSIASSNVTQNSHFNVRQDDNSHATRTYLQARVGSGALYSIKYLGTSPAVSLGTQLIIPFISQNSIGSKTYVHIRGMSCESNTTNPKAFDCKFAVGHTTTLSNLTVLQNLGTCTGASISGMNIVLAFSVDYTHSGDSGMFIEIDYIAHHQDASINLSGIVMN
jgi:hypothetical protein